LECQKSVTLTLLVWRQAAWGKPQAIVGAGKLCENTTSGDIGDLPSGYVEFWVWTKSSGLKPDDVWSSAKRSALIFPSNTRVVPGNTEGGDGLC